MSSPAISFIQTATGRFGYIEAGDPNAPIEYYRAMLRPFGEAAERLGRGAGQRIAAPTLHLQGAEDGCIAPSAARGQDRFFDGPFESEVVAGAGHFLQLETPDLVVDAALTWFTRR